MLIPRSPGLGAEEFTARMSGRAADPALETCIASMARATNGAIDAELVERVRVRLDAWLLPAPLSSSATAATRSTHEGEIASAAGARGG